MFINPINSSYTSLVRRYLVADRKLVKKEDALTAANDLIECENKLYRAEAKKERLINKMFDSCNAIWEQLPKREQHNIDRHYKAHYGYGCQLGSL